MISNTLPDPAYWSDKMPLLSHNRVISASTTNAYHYPEHQTPHLLVANSINKGNYFVEGKQLSISERQFLFLNADEKLAIEFNENVPLHTLIILFEESFFLRCCYYYTTSEESLLGNPETHTKAEIWFPRIAHYCDHVISAKLAEIKIAEFDKSAFDTMLFELAGAILHQNGLVCNRIQHLGKKKSTKEELYKRLTIAVDWMNDNICQQVTLDELAQVACLNKFHFLSAFKTVYNTTPASFMRERKLQRAHTLLMQQTTVTDVCYQLGFESIGSFSNLFKKRFQTTPSALLHH
jgi:AraC family transcriptional regulator